MDGSGRPYSDREANEAAQMQAAAHLVREVPGTPAGVAAVVAHTLYTAAVELLNGRVLPVEVRRAALHTVREVNATVA